MTHWPRTRQDITYRLFLLRRLILLCAALIWTSLMATYWMHGSVPGGLAAQNVILLGLGALLVPALLAVLFPAGWIDILAISLSIAAAALFWPAILRFTDHPVPVLSVGYGSLVVLGLILLTCILMRLICAAHGRWKIGELRTRTEVILPVPAAVVARAEFIRPEAKARRNRTGPVKADRFFEVHYTFLFPDLQDFSVPDPAAAPPPDTPPDAFARVVEQGPHHQITQYLICTPGTGTASGGSLIAHQTVEPIDDGSCLYRCEEVHDVWDLVTWAASWLNDQSHDYLVDLAEYLQGKDVTAIRGLPQVTPMTLLAHYIAKWGLADPKAGASPD